MFDVQCSVFDVPLMKPFKSIKWRLQLWYGLILVVVLAGFGFTAYQLEKGRQMRRVDDALHRRFNALAGALRRPPPRQGQPGWSFDRPQRDEPPPDDRLPGENPRPPREFHLPPADAWMFETNDPAGYYFRIYGPVGNEPERNEIAHFGNWPSRAGVEDRITGGINAPPRIGSPPVPFDIGHFREIWDTLPSGEDIVVGVSILAEQKELDRTALTLTVAGGVILLIGLAGGGWLVGRALRPIGDISATAAKISSGDLSRRISTAETDSELGQLAAILNSTFGRLETAFDQQRRFAADAAHELRTPVSVVLTQTQTALQRERGAAEYRETIEACQRAAQRMRRLTESLLALARLDAGQEPIQRVKFDLSQTVWNCVELLRPLAAERGIRIQCELPPVEAPGDAERLAQVVTNLLANAVQYNKPNGEVRVTTKLQGGLVLLTVSDTGPGIPAEHLPHVFERFYRADPSRSSGQTGLGLAISKAIVEAHGGTIEVSSRPGEGTTFTVVLPANV